MAIPNNPVDDECGQTFPYAYPECTHSHASGASWSAILAGAAGAAALSLILLILGTGLGLSSVSPWAYSGISATTFGVSTILWTAFTQLAASGMGGYLAGRLRTRWVAVDTDEVFFRDTAHGFLAWAIASLATAALLTSVIGSIVGAGIQSGEVAASSATAGFQPGQSFSSGDPQSYFVDLLFRKDIHASAEKQSLAPGSAMPEEIPEPTAARLRTEVTRIFSHTLPSGPLSSEDSHYVGQLVSEQTGLAQPAAQKRVNDIFGRIQASLKIAESTAQEAAEKGRKASAHVALWLFIALLTGAFFASFMATVGGRQRDRLFP